MLVEQLIYVFLGNVHHSSCQNGRLTVYSLLKCSFSSLMRAVFRLNKQTSAHLSSEFYWKIVRLWLKTEKNAVISKGSLMITKRSILTTVSHSKKPFTANIVKKSVKTHKLNLSKGTWVPTLSIKCNFINV